ncbi:polyamine aminopropyltransferase [Streptomyces polyrhachis]|uniref:Polyamine aminopropyltransferase n=1 Tax=Streptomyces polyrhachis TaxID=1282885 RepID=A0ABW2GE68_9ACTN
MRTAYRTLVGDKGRHRRDRIVRSVIERPETPAYVVPRQPRRPGQSRRGLPVRPATGRLLVLATVFVCAACGLVYELELVALASYLAGDSVTQASVVLSVMVFAMGVGSLLAKRLRPRAAAAFGLIEAALALVGGLSAMALYACFAWVGHSQVALVGFSLAIGVLIGAEVPLLMTLIQRIRRQDAGGAVADLFAADYVGALAGGLAFPFLLLPWLGQIAGPLATGAVNAVAGGALVLWLFRGDLSRRDRTYLLAGNALVLVLLLLAAVLAPAFERAVRREVYGDEVRVALTTGVQEVVLTGRRGEPLALYLDGRLRVSERDEQRYHESLVHPAMAGRRERVLILGGGDGLAAREVLRYRDVREVVLVELDPGVVRLARTDPELSALNGGVFADPRLRVVDAEAFDWLRRSAEPGAYDVIVSDLPDPVLTPSVKLYSQEFYALAARALAPGGRLSVHAGALRGRPRVYWTVEATLRAAGLRATGFRVPGRDGGREGRGGRGVLPEAGDWGFWLAARAAPPRLALPADAPRLRWLTPAALREAGAGRGPRPAKVRPSTLVHPRFVP